MPVVLITGANRGIGLEFVRQYARRGWDVIAACRDPGAATDLQQLFEAHRTLRLERLDLTRDDEIQGLAERCGNGAIDVLINNAALLGPGSTQLLAGLTARSLEEHYRVNAAGPLLLTRALLPAVLRSAQRKIVFLGSAAGATALLRPPANLYAYRASKAALHLIAGNLAMDLQPHEVTVALLNPGVTDTRGLLDLPPEDPGPEDLRHLLKLVRAGAVPLVPTAVSVAGMMTLIDGWTLEQTGSFLNYDGQQLPL
jgi:NAD(P)-dependent dehydrogenase (short-subunit alcohol dehydrogenase family)